jgi:predicted GIY-YIG superfamily endonuclease
MVRKYSVYILQCKSGKFYTGSTETRKIQERFEKHRIGTGSKWCRQFQPTEVIKTIDNLLSGEAFRMENTECIRIMREHNDIQICRGGDFLFPLDSNWWVYRLPEDLRLACVS